MSIFQASIYPRVTVTRPKSEKKVQNISPSEKGKNDLRRKNPFAQPAVAVEKAEKLDITI